MGKWDSLLVGAALWLLLAMQVEVTVAQANGLWNLVSRYSCQGNAEALEALKSTQNFTVELINGVGYGFYYVNPTLNPINGGPNVTRGLVILPEHGVAPEAYAPYARGIALQGFYVAIVEEATPGKVLEAMMQHPEFKYWSLAGHGKGGKEAARVARALHPKVKSLVLIAAPIPSNVEFRSVNLFLSVICGSNDTVSTPDDVTSSFTRAEGDTSVQAFPDFGHYDFAYSTCSGNTKVPSSRSTTPLTSSTKAAITAVLLSSLEFAQWADGTEKARSYGDNHFLTPGFNDSKPYPGTIRVRFNEVPIPGSSPQRVWWVFTPSEIKGGYVYYAGAAVAGQAYFPLAFEIAARGHLVVIPQQPSRNAMTSFTDANAIIGSNVSIFAGVPVNRWAIGGHSAGGVGASTYLACFGDKIYGAVLHSGGWVVNTNSSLVPVLQLYGSLDNLSGQGSSYYKTSYLTLANMNRTTFFEIPSGNHHQVGDYGYQTPDQIATISLESQHRILAIKTVNFLDALQTQVYSPVLSGPICGP